MQGVIYKAGDKWKCGVWDGTRYRELKDDTEVRLYSDSPKGCVTLRVKSSTVKELLNEGGPIEAGVSEWLRSSVLPECLLTTEDAW